MSYTMEREKSSANSNASRRSLIHAYYQQFGDSDRRLRNLIDKHMYAVTNSESQPSQQVAFVDGRGKTTITNRKYPKKCSVMATSVASMALVANGCKSFT